MKNIVVVGGGTAGWITALYAKKIFPEDRVTVLESKEIGILGAGEGSTPPLISLLDFLDIPVSDLVKNTKTTIKHGIRFTNWSKDKDFYYHGFDVVDIFLNNFYMQDSFSPQTIKQLPFDIIQNYLDDKNILDYDLVAMLSEKNQTLFKQVENKLNVNPIANFSQHGQFSIHFDARLLAERLLEIGLARDIKIIYGTAKSVNTLPNGDIESIILDNEEIISTDFVFDCTGFAKFFIGKHFNSDWVSFSEQLPMKKAMPFFIDPDKDFIPTYTESIAMNYGWMWKIPLQHRYGCGYVYDSNFISDEDAKKEIESYLGFIPVYPREKPFIFNPGCYKEVWKNNCIAIGLSASFVEPLEATAIWQSVLMLKELFNKKENIFTKNSTVIKMFNEKYFNQTIEVRDFIYLHYMTNKNTNNFWINFTKNNIMPETLKVKLDLIQNSILYDSDHMGMFNSNSYYRICAGLNLLNKDTIKNIIINNKMDYLQEYMSAQNEIKKDSLDNFIDHKKFIKYLGGLK